MRNRMPVATLFGATVVIAAVAVAAFALGRSGPSSGVGASPSPVASAVAVAPVPSPAPSPSPSLAPSPSAPASHPPLATPKPTIGPCSPSSLAAKITSWEGAAGSRFANVSLTNVGTSSCLLEALDRPQLLAGDGSVQIDGTSPAATDRLTVAAGALLTTVVQVSNDCKPDPIPPVTVAFVFKDGQRLVAQPFSPTDTTTPPCNGAGSPAIIDMHPWAP